MPLLIFIGKSKYIAFYKLLVALGAGDARALWERIIGRKGRLV